MHARQLAQRRFDARRGIRQADGFHLRTGVDGETDWHTLLAQLANAVDCQDRRRIPVNDARLCRHCRCMHFQATVLGDGCQRVEIPLRDSRGCLRDIGILRAQPLLVIWRSFRGE